MKTVNIHEAKTHLSQLVEQVEAGEEVTIARAGKPVASLIAYVPTKTPIKFGLLKGKITIHDEATFDAPNEELIRIMTTAPLDYDPTFNYGTESDDPATT